MALLFPSIDFPIVHGLGKEVKHVQRCRIMRNGKENIWIRIELNQRID